MLVHIPYALSISINLLFVVINFNQLVVKLKNVPVDFRGKVVDLILEALPLGPHLDLHLQHPFFNFVKFGLAALSLLVVNCHFQEVYSVVQVLILFF